LLLEAGVTSIHLEIQNQFSKTLIIGYGTKSTDISGTTISKISKDPHRESLKENFHYSSGLEHLPLTKS
jgi:hypothetical protein